MPEAYKNKYDQWTPKHKESRRGGRPALELSPEEIAEMHEAWMAGESINKISAAFNHGTGLIRRLAVEQDWPDRDLLREALPAGHPSTWGAICGNVTGGSAGFGGDRAAR